MSLSIRTRICYRPRKSAVVVFIGGRVQTNKTLPKDEQDALMCAAKAFYQEHCAPKQVVQQQQQRRPANSISAQDRAKIDELRFMIDTLSAKELFSILDATAVLDLFEAAAEMADDCFDDDSDFR